MRKNRTKSGRIMTVALAVTFAVSLLAGCNGADSESTKKNKGTTEVSTEATTEKTEAQATEAASTEAGMEAQTTEAASTEGAPEAQTTETASSEEDTSTTEAGVSTTEAQSEDVSSLPGTYPMDLVFSSGAGGWSTTLTLSEDGSFTGAFSDSEMGERDENEYPNGTVYVCNFSGQFKDIKKVNDYTYSMTLDSVKVAEDEEKSKMVSVIKRVHHPVWTAEKKFISIHRMHLSQNCRKHFFPGGRKVLMDQQHLTVMQSIINPRTPDFLSTQSKYCK